MATYHYDQPYQRLSGGTAHDYHHGGHYEQPIGNTTSGSYGLKPTSNVETASIQSGYAPYPDLELQRLETRDAKIKKRIRILRVVSRVLTFLLSAATMCALAMVLYKYLQTRNEYFMVDGEERTAWADGTIAWYTYLYFGISTLSFILDTAILIGYCRSVKTANTAATVAGFWAGLLLVSHIAVWIASLAIYRYGREPVDGKFKDLWGWTCSSSASEIQSEITNIDFEKYCHVQVSKINEARRLDRGH